MTDSTITIILVTSGSFLLFYLLLRRMIVFLFSLIKKPANAPIISSKGKNNTDIGFFISFIAGAALATSVNLLSPSSAIVMNLTYAICVILLMMVIRPKNKFLYSRRAYVGLMFGVVVFWMGSLGQKIGGESSHLVVVASSPAPMVAKAPVQDYAEADFYWTKDTKPWKNIIIKGVNKIHRENPRCANLDPGSADRSLSKGTKANPVFYVTCQPAGESSFNVFFSKSDVEADKTFTAAQHIDMTTAKQLCEDYAKTQAQNPQTVKFSWIMDMSIKEYPNGRTRINSSFKASNLMGVEQSFKISCLFDGKGFIEGTVTDK